MKKLIAIGLLLLIIHSAFPPRLNPDGPESRVSRAFILSSHFYYRRYTATPIGDPRDEAFSISKAPAAFDWGRYVTEMVIIMSFTGLGGLFLSRRQGSAVKDAGHVESQSEQAGDGNHS